MKVKYDHRSEFSNLSNWKEEAWKKSGLQDSKVLEIPLQAKAFIFHDIKNKTMLYDSYI